MSCFSLRAGARNLSEEDRRGFLRVWRSVRERFSSDPSTAVVYADILVSDLMQEHGWASRSSALAVLDDRYRAAHAIAIKRERIEPDELRRAIRLYTVLFDELLGNLTIVPTEPSPAPKMLHREHSA
ncbi:MAG TPA: hypothetical protein VG675_09100 [Bryobacteraceae bacterium]|nr:hypothetical protein [Bryobacteraceae bacterium]